jgi:hypothetical protein
VATSSQVSTLDRPSRGICKGDKGPPAIKNRGWRTITHAKGERGPLDMVTEQCRLTHVINSQFDDPTTTY